MDKYGRVYVNFSPGVSREALTVMRQTVRGWHLQLKCDQELEDLSNMFDPVLRGWANYYGRFYRSALQPLWQTRERLPGAVAAGGSTSICTRGAPGRARSARRLAEARRTSFVHWEMGVHS